MVGDERQYPHSGVVVLCSWLVLMADARSNISQTLDRGLRVLEAIATADEAPVARSWPAALRSTDDRLSDVRTLELHALIWRDSAGLPSGRQARPVGTCEPHRARDRARPELAVLADDLSDDGVPRRARGAAKGSHSTASNRGAPRSCRLPSGFPSSDQSRCARHSDPGRTAGACPTSDPRSPRRADAAGLLVQRGRPGTASVATCSPDAHHGVASIACVFPAGVEVDLNAISAASSPAPTRLKGGS